MLLFAPLGFLLPLLGKRMQRFTTVLLWSLLVTVMIEAAQLLTGRGIFELDDIVHNILGSMAGYFLISAILACAEKKKITIKPILKALIIPLFFAAVFSSAAIAYRNKEFGNLPIIPAIP